MPSFGVSLDEQTADAVEAPLDYGDSRSQRIQELVQMGLAAERAMRKHRVYPDAVQERRAIITESLHDHLDAHEE